MTRLHFFRNLRTALVLLGIAAVIAAGVMLWWANATGLPDTWRAMIVREIEKQGIHVTVESLSYNPFRGVIAREIRIFSDPECTREVSTLQRVVLDFDKMKLARGEFKLTKLDIKDGRLDLPVDPDDPHSPRLEITGVNASVAMPTGRLFEIRDASGRIEGIDMTLTARLLGYRQVLGRPDMEDPNRKERLKLLRRFLDETRSWTFDATTPPKIAIAIAVDGDLSDRSTIRARLKLHAVNVGKNRHLLKSVSGEGELSGTLINVSSMEAEDGKGSFKGRGDYDLKGRDGRFIVNSTLGAPGLLSAWFGVSMADDFSFHGRQEIEAAGDFQLPDGAPPVVHVTGRASCQDVKLKEVSFESLSTLFSWQDGSLYLRDLHASRRDGEASMKVLVEPGLVRFALDTTLPLAVFRPFFKGQIFGDVLNDFTETNRTKVDVALEGSFVPHIENTWAIEGKARLTNFAYRGVPALWAETGLSLSHHELDFLNGSVEFDYKDYGLQRAFGTTKSGVAKMKRVRYDSETKFVEVEDVEGAIWPAPLLRCFAPGVADHLETYRFHHPPVMQGNGAVDTTPKNRTDIKVTFRSDDSADYTFLGKPLSLDSPSGSVHVQGNRVAIDNLRFRAFGGPVESRLSYLEGKGAGGVSGEFRWTKLSYSAIGALYDFEAKGGGELTGRLEFNNSGENFSKLNGRGLIGLEEGELFSVPIFGPLSPLVSGILADRRAGFQSAQDAFCTFTIRDGVLSTNDFRTGTKSLAFTGDARVDLERKTMDMTMRMNARGLLGVLTLPLRPFYGLFQFRGHGPLKSPEWENVMFTSPPEDQKDALMNPLKARIVEER